MDFFAGLLDRSQDQATVLQRRQPSRFEPHDWEANPDTGFEEESFPAVEPPMANPQPPSQTGAAPLAPAPVRWADRVVSRAGAASEPPLLQPPWDDSAGEAHALALDRLGGEVAGLSRAVRRLEQQPWPGQPTAPREDAESFPPPEKETIVHHPAVQGPPLAPAAPLAPRRSETVVTRDAEPSPGARQTRREEAKEPLRQQRGVADRLPPEPLVRKAARAERAPREAVIVPRGAVQSMPATPPGPSASRRENRATGSAPTPVPPTTVHVSIGRIEIRATPTASKPARSQAPAGPRLSLDDYLKTRNGGGR